MVFLATPHRSTMDLVRHWADRTDLLVDLSGDFRLRDTEVYERYYGVPHEAPELLDRFVPGIPELHRDRLRTARLISVPGCMANAATLALHPLAARQLALSPVLLDGRTGSSGSGASAKRLQSARRTQRCPKGVRPRHAPARGRSRPAHRPRRADDGDRSRGRTGRAGRLPHRGARRRRGAGRTGGVPRGLRRRAVRPPGGSQAGHLPLSRAQVLLGSNYCDIGHVWDDASRRLVVVAALDNLVKGGAGNAVQCLNVRMDWPESYGLSFPGLHPV